MINALSTLLISNYELSSTVLNDAIANCDKASKTAKFTYEVVLTYYRNGFKYFKAKEFGLTKDFQALNYKTKNQVKPFGELLVAIFNLCKQSHALGFGNYYSNAYQWFTNILLELPLYDWDFLMSDSQQTSIVDMWQKRIQCLKSLEYPPHKFEIKYNPFIVSDLCRVSGGMLLLVEAAYSLSALHPAFNTKYWQPYIDAQKMIVLMFQTNHDLVGVRLLNSTDQYQVASKDKSGRKGKYKKPKF